VKRRVLQLIGNFDAAGSERQAAQLAQSLRESGRYMVFVGCMDPRGDLGQELDRAGFHEIPTFPVGSLHGYQTIVQLVRLVRFLAGRKIDIVQTHDFYTNVFGMFGAWLAGTPVRVASRRETTGCRSQAQKQVERRAYQLAHAIVANAEAVREHLIEEGVRGDKIVTIYNSLSRSRVTPRCGRLGAFEMLRIPFDVRCRIVTIVANLSHPVKDQPTFLRAARRVREAVPEARFVLAGEGKLRDGTLALAKELGLGSDVHFTGRCAHVAELLAISEVCVLSSRAEGFSNSILEYMGAGRPVVATNVGGAGEAVVDGETGYLVCPGDDEMMAARIVQSLLDPERALVMGRCGQQRAAERFSCAAQCDHTVRLYDHLLRRAQQQPAVIRRLGSLWRAVVLAAGSPRN
jgi:glycosyltransferase involved in cell wall biosynthesis